MTSIALDYGDPMDDEQQVSGNDVVDSETRHIRKEDAVQRESMDAELQEWESHYTGPPGDFSRLRGEKEEEIKANHNDSSRFYALPLDEAVRAGSNRGVTSASDEQNESDLMGETKDETPPEAPVPIGQGLDIRYPSLHISGDPVTQCSTSRLFAYITHFGAQPLGLEWINDSSCNIVFGDVMAARIAVEYLCPASGAAPLPNEEELREAQTRKTAYDQGEDLDQSQTYEWPENFMQSLISPRRAHRFPAKLYNAPEKDAALELTQYLQDGGVGQVRSQLPDDVPEIYREMEAEDQQQLLQLPRQKALANLRGNLWVRWTVESSDIKRKSSARQSKWYRDHGMDAGREIVPKMLQVGGANERRELLPGKSSHRRESGDRSAAMDQLDQELDQWRSGSSNDRWNDRPSRKSRISRHARPEYETIEEGADGDNYMRERSASPNPPHTSSSQVKVRGRGRMRAPSAWAADDDTEDFGDRSRMFADGVEHRSQKGRNRRQGRGRAIPELEYRLRGEPSSLEARFGPAANGGDPQENGRLYDRME